MKKRYHVKYDGPKTRIVETPSGEWAEFDAARIAAADHVEKIITEAQAALDMLRRSGNFYEYSLRIEELDGPVRPTVRHSGPPKGFRPGRRW